uniref:Coat protein n=1 Tax=Nanning Totiv tick virus 2 TaxID=2972353 RepID=A0A9E7V2G6_9VIRU|nr:MAG: putative coat protein [Nanning Totiv tick virus 2]
MSQSPPLTLNHATGHTQHAAATVFSNAAHYSRDVAVSVQVLSPVTMTIDHKGSVANLTHWVTPRFAGATADLCATNCAATLQMGAALRGAATLQRYGALSDRFPITSTYREKCLSASNVTKSGTPDYADIGGIAYGLGLAAGASAIHNWSFTLNQLHTLWGADGVPRLPIAATKDYAPQNVGSTVYLTRDFCANVRAGALVALTSLVSGAGGQCVRDANEIDANGIVLPMMDLAQEFVLHDLTNAFIRIATDNEVLDTFMFHWARGAAASITVRGETYEGGWMRDMVRCGINVAPYGVMTFREEGQAAVHIGRDEHALRAFAYSTVLRLAACWSACDPYVLQPDDYAIPTLITNDPDDMLDGACDAADAAFHTALHALDSTDKRAVALSIDHALTLAGNDGLVANSLSRILLDAALSSVVAGTRVDTITGPELADALMFTIRFGPSGGSVLRRTDSCLDEFTAAALGQGGLAALVATIDARADPREALDVMQTQLVANGGTRNFAKLFSQYWSGANVDRLTLLGTLIFGAYRARVERTFMSLGQAGAWYSARHLSQQVLIMCSWIDCTGLISRIDVPAQVHGLASFTDINASTTYPAFTGTFGERLSGLEDGYTMKGSHTLRHLHMANWARAHPQDGLANMRIHANAENMPVTAYGDLSNDEFYDPYDGGAYRGGLFSLDKASWTKADLAFPLAGELVVTSQVTEYMYDIAQYKRRPGARRDAPITPGTHYAAQTHLFNRHYRSDGLSGTTAPNVTYSMEPFVTTGRYTKPTTALRDPVSRLRALKLHRLSQQTVLQLPANKATVDRARHYFHMSSMVVAESDDSDSDNDDGDEADGAGDSVEARLRAVTSASTPIVVERLQYNPDWSTAQDVAFTVGMAQRGHVVPELADYLLDAMSEQDIAAYRRAASLAGQAAAAAADTVADDRQRDALRTELASLRASTLGAPRGGRAAASAQARSATQAGVTAALAGAAATPLDEADQGQVLAAGSAVEPPTDVDSSGAVGSSHSRSAGGVTPQRGHTRDQRQQARPPGHGPGVTKAAAPSGGGVAPNLSGAANGEEQASGPDQM